MINFGTKFIQRSSKACRMKTTRAVIAPQMARAFSQNVEVIFKEANGTEHYVEAEVGKSILDVAHANGISLEGACESSLACR